MNYASAGFDFVCLVLALCVLSKISCDHDIVLR